MRLRQAESWAGGRITQPWYTAISSAAPTNTHRWSLEDWKPACAVSDIMTTGQIKWNVPFCWIPVRIYCYMEWENAVSWLWQRGCAVALISKILLISTAQYTRQRIRTVYTMVLHCHLTKKSVPARNPMPTVFIHNIAIRIHLQQNGSLSLIQINAMSCKIRHPNHWLPVRWMPYMHFLIWEPIIRPMKKQVVFRQSKRWNSVWSAIVAVMVAAVFVPWRFIREELSRPEAMNPSWTKQSRWSGSQILRAIFMMWVVLPQISVVHRAINSWPAVSARTGNACSRVHVRI